MAAVAQHSGITSTAQELASEPVPRTSELARGMAEHLYAAIPELAAIEDDDLRAELLASSEANTSTCSRAGAGVTNVLQFRCNPQVSPKGGSMTEDRIERDVLIDAPVERVWALITQAEHLGAWFGDAGADIDLREGGELELRWEQFGTSRGRIERVEEPTAFAFRWAPYEDPGGVEPVDGNSTLVEFTLVAEGGGTRLRLVETGFASLETSPEQQAHNHEANAKGWSQELGELADYATRVRM